MKKATDISKEILQRLSTFVLAGNNAGEINRLAGELCSVNNVRPAFLGVVGPKSNYAYNICISVNDEILHSIPYSEKIFQDGDIVKVDFGIIYEGMHTDHCVTVVVGNISSEDQRLIETSKLCIEKGIENAIVGNYVGDISAAMETVCKLARLDFVRTYCGHGIGRKLHLKPEILSYGEPKTGIKLEDGMVLCIENQVVLGSGALELDDDGWTLKTRDGSKGAMTEHMVIVRKNKAEVLTRF